ncbi:hypothetical protein C8R44DRAFT_783617 [Mycena epipterygia]|nr:hypothetical protein C8R44DRAFT_783617 [Mycena epipterygia]
MSEARTECLSCRITGTATFTGLGIYALWMSREAAPGTRGSKRFVAVFGAGAHISFFSPTSSVHVVIRIIYCSAACGRCAALEADRGAGPAVNGVVDGNVISSGAGSRLDR